MAIAMVRVRPKAETIPPPSSDLAVVTIASGEHAEACRKRTRESMAAYARECGADFVELAGDHCPQWPMANKFRLYHVARQYQRTLYLDVDVIVRPGSPSLFDVVPADRIAVYDELVDTADCGAAGWAEHQAWIVADSQRLPMRSFRWSANGGAMLFPRKLAHFYRPPRRPLPRLWCADQQLLTVRMQAAGVSPYLLHWRWNCLYNAPQFGARMRTASFVHFNSAKGEDRLRLLEIMRMTFQLEQAHGEQFKAGALPGAYLC